MDPITQTTRSLNFRNVTTSYASYLMAQYKSLPYIVNKLEAIYVEEKNKLVSFIREKGLQGSANDTIGTVDTKLSIPIQYITEYDKLYTGIQNIINVNKNLLYTQFVDSVTQFDNFLQNLMRCVYNQHPDILSNSDNKITYKELLNLSTIENAKEFVVEKELTELFYKGHTDQFKQFFKITKVDVIKEMDDLFKSLVEITERRNIHVHCHGKVSQQYVDRCTENKVNVTASVGDELLIDKDYFLDSIDKLLELAVKIGYLVWKKQERSEKEAADMFLINLCSSLISQERCNIVVSLVDYLIDYKDNNMSQVNKHLLKMYWICAHKHMGHVEETNKGINEDWTSVKPMITLILDVLRDDFDSAINQMLHIGNDPKDFDKNMYSESSLFSELVKEQKFQDAYRQLYGVDFCYSRLSV